MQNKRAAASAALLGVLGVSSAAPVGAQVGEETSPLEELGVPVVVPAPTFSSTLTREERMASVAAYQASEYAYGDATVLSDYWAMDGAYQAKVKAGSLLLDGYDLPFASRDAAHQAYVSSDLTWADSIALGDYWGIESTYEMRIKAGFWLLDGFDPLVVLEDPGPDADALAVDTFFAVGYDYDDAVALADYWGLETAYDAKIKAGFELKAGVQLPAVAQPSPPDDITLETLQLDAFFNAGYDYDDAIALAEYWGEATSYDAKIKAGTAIKAGIALPDVATADVTEADLETVDEAVDAIEEQI